MAAVLYLRGGADVVPIADGRAVLGGQATTTASLSVLPPPLLSVRARRICWCAARYSAGDNPGLTCSMACYRDYPVAAGSLTPFWSAVVLGRRLVPDAWRRSRAIVGAFGGDRFWSTRLMALPFVPCGVIEPRPMSTMERNGRTGCVRSASRHHPPLWQIGHPALLPPLATGFVFAVALSLGDWAPLHCFWQRPHHHPACFCTSKLGSLPNQRCCRTGIAAGKAIPWRLWMLSPTGSATERKATAMTHEPTIGV